MSDDEPDLNLLDLLRKSLGLKGGQGSEPPKIRVLQDAEFIYNNATDVAIDMQGTKNAAHHIHTLMLEKAYSFKTWRSRELHPQPQDASSVDFIFIMDLLNFSFWSAVESKSERFAVEYRGRIWTGYWSLVAALHRAVEEDIPITTASFWMDQERCSNVVLKNVFRSCTAEEIPMLQERIDCVREAGRVLQEVCPARRLSCD